MALMIFSIWLIVEVPGKRGFPSNISPRMQPMLHMSTPLVYLQKISKQFYRDSHPICMVTSVLSHQDRKMCLHNSCVRNVFRTQGFV